MGEQKIENDICLGSNFETKEGMDLKLMMLYYLFRHYVQTKFHSILIGSRFFCVDLTWNDPIVSDGSYLLGRFEARPLRRRTGCSSFNSQVSLPPVNLGMDSLSAEPSSEDGEVLLVCGRTTK